MRARGVRCVLNCLYDALSIIMCFVCLLSTRVNWSPSVRPNILQAADVNISNPRLAMPGDIRYGDEGLTWTQSCSSLLEDIESGTFSSDSMKHLTSNRSSATLVRGKQCMLPQCSSVHTAVQYVCGAPHATGANQLVAAQPPKRSYRFSSVSKRDEM